MSGKAVVPDSNPNSPYGTICEDECGKQGLTVKEYDRQMARPNNTWICPRCGGFADWDDDRYGKATPEQFKAYYKAGEG